MSNDDPALHDDSGLTDAGREMVQAYHRGKPIGGGKYRNFCAGCGDPMSVREELKDRTDLKCVDCRKGDTG